MTNLFTIGCVVAAGTQINQIQSSNVDLGIEELIASGDGKVDFDYAAVLQQNPRFSFTTTAIKRALDAIGLSGLALTGTALDIWLQNMAQGGTRTTTNCVKISGGYGLIIPTSIDADNRGATINYDAILRSNDGTTAPVAVAVAQSLPSLTATDQQYVCGKVSVNGSALDSVERIRLDFGLSLSVIHSQGSPFPRFVGIRKRQPSLVIGCYNAELLNTYGVSGVAQGATDSLVYLRKIAQDGTRVADATAEHIRLSVDAGRIQVTEIGGSDDGEVIPAIRITPTYDGTNDVVAINTAVAIA